MWKSAAAEPLESVGSRHNQNRGFAAEKQSQPDVDFALGGDNHGERWFHFTEYMAKPLVNFRKRRIDVGGGPEVFRFRTKRSLADDHDVGYCPQQSHHHAVMGIEPADVPRSRMTGDRQRHDPVKGRNKVAYDIRARRMLRKPEMPVDGGQLRRKRQLEAAIRVVEGFQRFQHGRHISPQAVKNSARSAGSSA